MATQVAAIQAKDNLGLALKGGLGLLVIALMAVVAGTLREKIIETGDKAPAFSIKTDQGREISTSNFGGKLLVLNFWASWCEPCVEEIPSLNEFAKKYAGQGVVVVGVSIDHNEKLYRSFIQRNSVAFQTARDPAANISGSYGTFKVPETYIIDGNGKVVQKVVGPQNWSDPAYLNYFRTLL
jgi:peroxiredoxin